MGFTIILPDGTKYYFGETPQAGDVDPVERSDTDVFDPNRVLFSQFYSSWFLYKIESADGRFFIDLEYEAEDYGYYTSVASPCIPDCDGKLNAMKVIINGVRLRRISSSNVTVEFVPGSVREDLATSFANFQPSLNTVARRLGTIDINSTNSAACKRFQFSYDYFQSPSMPLPTVLFMGQEYTLDLFDDKRLKLLSVQESSCNGLNVIPPFQFSYYDEDKVPRRMSLGYDHWGYNNGKVDNNGLVPKVVQNLGSEQVDREASWPEMRAGVLKRIQYPTGGSSIYTYEPNSVNTYGITNSGFDLTYSTFHTLSVGFGTNDSETVRYDLEVAEENYYQIITRAVSSGSGTLTLEGDPNPLAEVTTVLFDDFGNPIPGASNETTKTFLLSPGTYSYIATANEDPFSGSGLEVTFQKYTASIDAFVEARSTIVGGLRIKKIEKVTEESEVFSRSYSYSGANLYYVPVYAFKIKNPFFRSDNWSGADPNGCYRASLSGASHKVYSSPTNVFELVKSQGYHIGYNQVREVLPDEGYIEYRYAGQTVLPTGWAFLEDVSVKDVDEICYSDYPEFPFAPPPYDYQRGKLRETKYYTSSNDLLRSTSYRYEYEEKDEVTFGMIVQVADRTGFDGEVGYPMIPSLYEIRSARMTETETIERVYNPADSTDFLETIESIFYDNPTTQLPTRTTTTSSNGQLEKELTYAKDLTACETVCPQCVQDYLNEKESLRIKYLSDLQNCNYQSFRTDPTFGCPSFKAWDLYRSNCVSQGGSRGSCQIAAFQDYHFQLNLLRESYAIAIRNTYSDACLTAGLSSSDPDVKVMYQLESNNQINVPIEAISKREGEMLTASYNSFSIDGSSTRVYLENVFSTETEAPSVFFDGIDISGGSVVIDDLYRQDPNLEAKYVNGQIAELRSTDGIVVSYLWGYSNNLPIIKAEGVDHSTLLAAYNSDPQNVRNHASLSNALLTTYEYEPWSGLTRVTDPNGITIEYTYDHLGRLETIEERGQIRNKYTYKYLKGE